MALLQSAQRPLLIVGKGVAYARAEAAINELVRCTDVPVLATPMGKGVVDDAGPHSVGPARSLALKEADVVVLLGARLNWMLHFGRSPRFDSNVKIIQVPAPTRGHFQSKYFKNPFLKTPLAACCAETKFALMFHKVTNNQRLLTAEESNVARILKHV